MIIEKSQKALILLSITERDHAFPAPLFDCDNIHGALQRAHLRFLIGPIGFRRAQPIYIDRLSNCSTFPKEDGLRKALVLIHLAFEDLGSLGTGLSQAGYTIDYVDACTGDLRAIDPLAPDLLVILGGPIGVYEGEAYPFLHAEIDLIRSRLAQSLPTIGICLGAQLIAAASGASVYPGRQGKEIGWASIQAGSDAARYPFFSELLVPELRVLHWHGDTFDLPANAQLLASTASYPNQAFVIGKHALGLQFHPEVMAQNLERWYVGHACELAHAGISVTQLREDSRLFAPRLEVAARRFWQSWLKEMGS